MNLSFIAEQFIFLPIFFITLLTIMSAEGGKAPSSEVYQAISEGNSKFTANIYKAVSKKDGNVFISPFSIEVVLALASMGAKGSTADEISSALGLPSNREDTLAWFRTFMSSVKDIKHATLDLANKVYTMTGYDILQEYRQIAEKDFLSGAQELDFSNGEASRQVINSWVEKSTRDKIKQLIPSGLLNSMTRIVLVNALYFKGSWKHKFDEAKTKPEKFHLNSNEHKMIPMMTQKANFGYMESEELNAKILKMGYISSGDLNMFVILPNEIDGISELEENLGKTDLSEILKPLRSREVVVTIPKFKMEETTDFDQILKEVGIVSMYDIDKADFSGISGARDLFVSKVLQKAFVEVNEEGTEAAAATGMTMMFMCARIPEYLTFKADHPFIFVLTTANIILFIGRMSMPN